MRKTTVYFPSELADALRRAARRTGRSEADLIRLGVRKAVAEAERPVPTLPLFSSGDPDFSGRADELLEGFGER